MTLIEHQKIVVGNSKPVVRGGKNGWKTKINTLFLMMLGEV